VPAVVSITTPSSGSAILSRGAVVPGDFWHYDLVVRNDGTADFTYTLSVSAATSTPLDNPASIGLPASAGLQLQVERCTVGFTQCTSTRYSGSISVSNLALGQLDVGVEDYLRLTLNLPLTNDNRLQGLTSVLDLTWTAQQLP
jgi:hypothetical protein